PEICGLSCELVGSLSSPAGSVFVNPRTKIFGLEVRKVEQQVPHVSFGIDDQSGNAVDRGLFEECDSETCLSATGHPDNDGMRGQVLGVVHDELVLQLRGCEIVFPTEIERSELLV